MITTVSIPLTLSLLLYSIPVVSTAFMLFNTAIFEYYCGNWRAGHSEVTMPATKQQAPITGEVRGFKKALLA